MKDNSILYTSSVVAFSIFTMILSLVSFGTVSPASDIGVGRCEIKGNISFTSGEKIYHIPGDKYYRETQIDAKNGERIFCTIEEAEEAGWRRTSE